MTNKNAIKIRIFLRCIKFFSLSGVRKRPSILIGLAIIVLLASAAYYTLKANLTHRSNHKSEANRQSIVRFFSDDASNSNEDQENHKRLYREIGLPFDKFANNKPYIPNERIVHLDLKGAPPTKDYLKRIFPLIKNLGATGILIEYEDMFPYSGSMTDITAYNHYSRKDVLEIVSMAESTGLKVIPLVQTFGHLEFALKRPGFVHLRENPDSPQALCPSQNASLVFIENMISQVMEVHAHRTKHLHIGCDEVYHMGECKLCSQRTSDNDGGRSRDIIFLTHVVNVAKIIRRRWPDVRPLIWDDMMRHISDDLLTLFDIGEYVDPVVWVYTEDVDKFIPSTTWQTYSRVFRTAWAASAYKGAFGETLNAPDVQRHLGNNLRWLRVMAERQGHFPLGMAGMVLTGWQRYEHFAELCELLPAALPSLALALAVTGGGGVADDTARRLAAALGCPERRPPVPLRLDTDPHMWHALADCIFPGSRFFKATAKLNVVESEVHDYIDQVTKKTGRLSEYSVRHAWSAVRETGLAEDAGRLLRRLVHVAEYARAALRDVTDPHAADEWLEQRPYPLILKLEQLIADAESLKSIKTWERRPLKPPADLARIKETTDEVYPL